MHSSSGPASNAATRPSAPGKLVTQSATEVIQSMPSPMSRQKNPSNPKGSANTPRMPMGMTQAETTGIANRFASKP